jgi:hypothetical protein
VNSSTFGKLFSCPVDGYIYAEPLYVPNLAIPGSGTRNVLFVATENDSIYAFDADANPCVQIWHTSLIPSGFQAIATPNLNITSTDIVPFVGITGTPVIDINKSTLYAVAAIQTSDVSLPFTQRLYALDLATGALENKVGGTAISSPSVQAFPYFPTYQNQRAALLLDNGNVYVAFGSFGGDGEYNGWLFAYDSASLDQTGVFDVTPGGFQGGIWQSGGGPSADSNHNVFVGHSTPEGPKLITATATVSCDWQIPGDCLSSTPSRRAMKLPARFWGPPRPFFCRIPPAPL